MPFAVEDLTCDSFLGGRLSVLQPRGGYRAGVDPVLLAAASPVRAGQSVLELGCGAGVAALCLGARVAGLRLTGLELQPRYAALARENAARNNIALSVVEGDLAAPPQEVRQQSFDHVIANPPYFLRARGSAAADAGRERALGEETPLAQWVDAGLRRLVPKGRLTMIQRAERLPELLAALQDRAGDVELLPLAPRAGRPARLVLLRAIKGGGGPFRLLPPMTMHQGAAHDGDRESYTPAIGGVLRNAAAIEWPVA